MYYHPKTYFPDWNSYKYSTEINKILPDSNLEFDYSPRKMVLFRIILKNLFSNKKKMHKWLSQSKLAKDRAALSSRITYKPYTCIQRALISLATGASSSHRFVIKCAFHLGPLSPRFCDTQTTREFHYLIAMSTRDTGSSPSSLVWHKSLAALAKYDTKHNPIIIAMFLSYVRVFVRVSIAKKKKKGKSKLSRGPSWLWKTEVLAENNRESFRLA